MTPQQKKWQLDARIEADTYPIADHELWQTRLMDDARWPWVMVIPKQAGARDADDLPAATQAQLIEHLARLSATLKRMGVCNSTNVATLSNIVTQLHWHVVGRREGDPGWPGPVWGFGERQPYTSEGAADFVARFHSAWDKG